MTIITADVDTLLHQASDTASTYMGAAVRHIDDRFGEGFAEANPSLVGQFMMTSAIDFGASIITKALSQMDETIRHKDFHDG